MLPPHVSKSQFDFFVVTNKKERGSVAPCWHTSSPKPGCMCAHIQRIFSCSHPQIQRHAKIVFSDHSNRMELYTRAQLACFAFHGLCSKTEADPPNPPPSQAWKKNKKIIRASGETSTCLHPNTTHHLCVSAKKLLLFASDRVYLYHSTEHFRPQCPHRKKLNPSITDDIIKLLNEITVPVEEGLFSRMGLYNKIILWANAHAGGRLLYPNRPTHPGIKAHFGVWSHCRVPSHFLLKNQKKISTL